MDRFQQVIFLVLVDKAVWKLELVHLRLAECSFVALTSEHDDLVEHRLVSHSEVVAAELALLVLGDEPTLSQWNPNRVEDVEQDHVAKRLAVVVQACVDSHVGLLALLAADERTLMAVSPDWLFSVYRVHSANALHSLHQHFEMRVSFVLLRRRASWDSRVVGASRNLHVPRLDIGLLLDDDQVVGGNPQLLLLVVHLSSEDVVHVIRHLDIVFLAVCSHSWVGARLFDCVDSVLRPLKQLLPATVCDRHLHHLVLGDIVHEVSFVVDEFVHRVVATEDEELLVPHFHLNLVLCRRQSWELAANHTVARVLDDRLRQVLRIEADEPLVAQLAAFRVVGHAHDAAELEQQLAVHSLYDRDSLAVALLSALQLADFAASPLG